LILRRINDGLDHQSRCLAMALEPTMDSGQALDLADDLHPICVNSMGPSEAVYRFLM
jgi:hypothetical protein